MFKLLTEEERQKVVREYVIHRAVVILSVFVVVLAASLIGILPSYLLSNARKSDVLERTRIMGISRQNGDTSDLETWLSKINYKLKILSPGLDVDRPSDFIDKVLEEKLGGISVNGLSWSKEGGEVTLSISGMATDRQTLINFQDRIENSEYFSKATLPISNLAKDRDIDFQIKFSQ
ncbi:MAG: PilN domain-containing protein [Minisyncoccia bacterium]